jgi:lipoyl(octanoyl) transferase
MRPVVQFEWINGLSYKEVWEQQTVMHQHLIQKKMAFRELNNGKVYVPEEHHLLFCEHKPVYTLGKSGSDDHLLLNQHQLSLQGAEFFKINRGGDITYHGPGQITGYPIFDLDGFFTDVHKYVRYLEEAVIRLLQEFGLEGVRVEKYTGVWLPPDDRHREYRKICAIGVHLSRWVTMHGFALNVNTGLDWFSHIVPCGIDDADKKVTSLAAETGNIHHIKDVGNRLLSHLQDLFGFDIQAVSGDVAC